MPSGPWAAPAGVACACFLLCPLSLGGGFVEGASFRVEIGARGWWAGGASGVGSRPGLDGGGEGEGGGYLGSCGA
ncbi:hypothetical protein GCM10010171_18800 [Actinokineospora fastidiosa]|uniref:Uncharacterized protein n=1 Tax=Actinokineospora fastidiosa TaxID=1816 RepID=A0A918G9S5_9PSEU|nr:hypothetical protein GCM10010171_18800 [Actinokineospora fastidiosa]